MSTITIYTDNENQINLLKAFLQELKIDFEINKEESLTDWQRKQILEGIDQADKGDFLTDVETKEILNQCFK